MYKIPLLLVFCISQIACTPISVQKEDEYETLGRIVELEPKKKLLIKEQKIDATSSNIVVKELDHEESLLFFYKNTAPIQDILVSDLNEDLEKEVFILTKSKSKTLSDRLYGFVYDRRANKYKQIKIPEDENTFPKDLDESKSKLFFQNDKIIFRSQEASIQTVYQLKKAKGDYFLIRSIL